MLLQPVPDDLHQVGPIRWAEEIAIRLHQANGIDPADSVNRFSEGRGIPLYRQLKAFKLAPSPERAAELRARFDRIFKRRTGYATLDRLLKRLHANKDELLRVLDRPEIPLNTNASENDIRVCVTKRKISRGTVSEKGRTARDVMLGLAKICAKLKISFFDYLGARLQIPGPEIRLSHAPSPRSKLITTPGNLPWLQRRRPAASTRSEVDPIYVPTDTPRSPEA